jgi:tetratricopeptide (TPR) repeat protein
VFRTIPGILPVIFGCFTSAADHARLGDQAYGDGDFSGALVEYRLALRQRAPDGPLRARAAQAAFNAGDLLAATEEFVAMAVEAPERKAEAVDGLELVARAAVEQSNGPALEAAVAGFGEFAEGRALGGFARELAGTLGDAPRSQEALPVLLFAAAAAPDAAQQDSLMFVYASVLRRLDRCNEALAVFESLARRARRARLAENARVDGANCALSAGRTALDRGTPEVAAEWFVRAASIGGNTPLGRQGYVRLGDVRLALGAYDEALAAYERAILGLPPTDSLYRAVSDRINAVANAETVFR